MELLNIFRKKIRKYFEFNLIFKTCEMLWETTKQYLVGEFIILKYGIRKVKVFKSMTSASTLRN